MPFAHIVLCTCKGSYYVQKILILNSVLKVDILTKHVELWCVDCGPEQRVIDQNLDHSNCGLQHFFEVVQQIFYFYHGVHQTKNMTKFRFLVES